MVTFLSIGLLPVFIFPCLLAKRSFNPAINPDISPDINQGINRDFNPDINPDSNSDISRDFNKGSNPDINQGINRLPIMPDINLDLNKGSNPDINQGINRLPSMPDSNPGIMPGIVPDINRDFNLGINPEINSDINPDINPDFNRGFNHLPRDFRNSDTSENNFNISDLFNFEKMMHFVLTNSTISPAADASNYRFNMSKCETCIRRSYKGAFRKTLKANTWTLNDLMDEVYEMYSVFGVRYDKMADMIVQCLTLPPVTTAKPVIKTTQKVILVNRGGKPMQCSQAGCKPVQISQSENTTAKPIVTNNAPSIHDLREQARKELEAELGNESRFRIKREEPVLLSPGVPDRDELIRVKQPKKVVAVLKECEPELSSKKKPTTTPPMVSIKSTPMNPPTTTNKVKHPRKDMTELKEEQNTTEEIRSITTEAAVSDSNEDKEEFVFAHRFDPDILENNVTDLTKTMDKEKNDTGNTFNPDTIEKLLNHNNIGVTGDEVSISTLTANSEKNNTIGITSDSANDEVSTHTIMTTNSEKIDFGNKLNPEIIDDIRNNNDFGDDIETITEDDSKHNKLDMSSSHSNTVGSWSDLGFSTEDGEKLVNSPTFPPLASLPSVGGWTGKFFNWYTGPTWTPSTTADEENTERTAVISNTEEDNVALAENITHDKAPSLNITVITKKEEKNNEAIHNATHSENVGNREQTAEKLRENRSTRQTDTHKLLIALFYFLAIYYTRLM